MCQIPSAITWSLLVLLLTHVVVDADVLCGGHRAETCAECPITSSGGWAGAAWCNGDCTWDSDTSACTTPSVLCSAAGPAAETCDLCGRSEASCSGGACVFNPATSLCRPHLTNDVRTASVHLNYPDPGNLVDGAASWWINRIEVVNSSSVSYFASNGHRFGYGGLQQVSASGADGSFVGKVIFSLWDQGCDQDVNPSCDPSTLATVVSCGDGVTCEGFGGEGTGKKSWFYFNNWDIRAEYYFVTHARRISGSRVQYAGYFHSDVSGWRHLATFEVNTGGADWDLNGLYSFVEQWSPQDTDQRRSALYGPSFVSDYGSADGGGAGCPSFVQMPSATYQHGTLENHMHVNAWAEAGAVGIQVSTEIEPAVVRACARAGAPTRAPTRARARPRT